MSTFGSAAYGSDSFGGNVGTSDHTFFVSKEPLINGVQRRTAAYSGTQPLYAINLYMSTYSIPQMRQINIYTYDDENETPQLQAILGEGFYMSTIIDAAAFIVVEIESTTDLVFGEMRITGREILAS